MFTSIQKYDKIIINNLCGGLMEIKIYEITYKDIRDLELQIEFSVATGRVEGRELIGFKVLNDDFESKGKNHISKILRGMKREGIVKLFVFEDDLANHEKMESVYMLNKFPSLLENKNLSSDTVFVKI